MRGDAIAILEAAYAPAASDDGWARAVVDAAAPLFGEGPVGITAIRHTADLTNGSLALVAGELAVRSSAFFASWVNDGVLLPALRAFFYPPEIVCSMQESISTLAAEHIGSFAALAPPTFGDALGLLLHPEPGLAAVLYAASGTRVRLGAPQRRSLTQLALHVEASLRLRLRPESVRAVLSSDGKLLHREGPASVPPLETLQRHVGLIERAHTRRVRRDPEALDLWQALVGGRVSLVARAEGTKRHYLVVDNAPGRQPMRALSKSELDVVSYAARGLPLKMIAYGLGLPTPTVSARLASAASKVGLATRMELVRIAAMLAHDPRARFEEIALTTAERDVLDLLAQGLSNKQIAALRGRSIRTIANQVASLLAKTKTPSRRALVAARAPRVTP